MKEQLVPSPRTRQALVNRYFNEQRTHTTNESKGLGKLQTQKNGDVTCHIKQRCTQSTFHLRAKLIEVAEEMVNHMFECNHTHIEIHEQHRLPKLSEFIEIVVRRTNTSLTSILIALTYLTRLKKRHPGCKGTYGSGHRLLLASIIIATKYLNDDAYYNKTWAIVCKGIFTIEEINKMELELLFFLNFKLYISLEYWSDFITLIDSKCSVHFEPGLLCKLYFQVKESSQTTNSNPVDSIKLDCNQLTGNFPKRSSLI